MKTEIYSWRVSPELKTDLEREARRLNISLSAALDLAAQEWLKKSAAANNGDAEQQRLQEVASKFLGAFAGGDIRRSENARLPVRRRLRRHHGH